MKRVLMVSECFPPINISGSARPFYFAKYLPEHGYWPTVLGATVLPGQPRDEGLLRELPEQVRVLRSPRLLKPAFDLLASMPRKSAAATGAAGTPPRAAAKVRRRLGEEAEYLRWWVHWELDWAAPALLRAMAGLRHAAPDLVWASGPHFRNCELGRRLARWLRVPLVIDLRDPWTYGSLWRPKTAAIARAEHARAVRTLMAADRVVFTSPLTQRAMARRFPELVTDGWLTITNGYEDAPVEPLRDAPEERCLFRYIGALNARRTPDALIEAFARAAGDPEFRASATLELIGSAGGHEGKASRAPGCDVRFRGPVSRADSLRYMFGSDVNLLLQTISDGHDVISGKAFDYLHANKPIIAVVDPAGGDAWLVRETQSGVIAPYAAIAAIAAALRAAWERWRSGASSGPARAPADFSRRSLTARLAATFDEVLAGHRPGSTRPRHEVVAGTGEQSP